ncbi:MAG: acyl-CoA dehydrogenase family protein [Solirubrobacterales bacterium]
MEDFTDAADRRAYAEALDALCGKHVTPEAVRDWDTEARLPTEALDALAAAGWGALAVPSADGGSGGSARDLVVLHRTLARHGLAVAQAVYSLWTLPAEAIARLGSAEQRARWLPALAAGEALLGFALTEPEAGSDAAALRTRAERRDERLVINGQKVFITGAAVADALIVAVRTGAATERRQDGISLVLVERGTAGLHVAPLKKVGLRALDLCEVFFEDVEVPLDAVLGPLDGGWAAMRPGLALERTLLAAICVGATEQVLELCAEHARERRAFGRPIGGFQLVADKLVEMRVDLAAGELLVDAAALAIDAGDAGAALRASIAKLHASRAYADAAREGVQVFGGYGYTEEYPVARHYRDAKFMEIGGGTSEIQKVVIARSLGLS